MHFLVSTATGDDGSSPSVTEYQEAPRQLIDLLHEPDAAAVSPDGTMLATGHRDGAVVLWNCETGQPVRSLLGHGDTVSSLSFDASENRLASASYDATTRLWDVSSGNALHVFPGEGKRLTVAMLSPNGRRLLSGGYDGTARVWDLVARETGPIVELELESTIRAAAFTSDGGRYAVADSSRTIVLGAIGEAKEGRQADADAGSVSSLLFSLDGAFLFSGSDDGLVVRRDGETLEGKQILSDAGSQPLHTAPVTQLAFGSARRVADLGGPAGTDPDVGRCEQSRHRCAGGPQRRDPRTWRRSGR